MLETTEFEGEIWIVTDWHTENGRRVAQPAKIVRPPIGSVSAANDGGDFKYVLKIAAPTEALLPDSLVGSHQGFDVRQIPRPSQGSERTG